MGNGGGRARGAIGPGAYDVPAGDRGPQHSLSSRHELSGKALETPGLSLSISISLSLSLSRFLFTIRFPRLAGASAASPSLFLSFSLSLSLFLSLRRREGASALPLLYLFQRMRSQVDRIREGGKRGEWSLSLG